VPPLNNATVSPDRHICAYCGGGFSFLRLTRPYPAGCAAAPILDERGHGVRACNESSATGAGRIGTGLLYAPYVPNKAEYLSSPIGRFSRSDGFLVQHVSSPVASSHWPARRPAAGRRLSSGRHAGFLAQSGFHLLERDSEDGFPSPDDFLRAYLVVRMIRTRRGIRAERDCAHESLWKIRAGTGCNGAGGHRGCGRPPTTTALLSRPRKRSRGAVARVLLKGIFSTATSQSALFISISSRRSSYATSSRAATMRSSRAREIFFREQKAARRRRGDARRPRTVDMHASGSLGSLAALS